MYIALSTSPAVRAALDKVEGGEQYNTVQYCEEADRVWWKAKLSGDPWKYMSRLHHKLFIDLRQVAYVDWIAGNTGPDGGGKRPRLGDRLERVSEAGTHEQPSAQRVASVQPAEEPDSLTSRPMLVPPAASSAHGIRAVQPSNTTLCEHVSWQMCHVQNDEGVTPCKKAHIEESDLLEALHTSHSAHLFVRDACDPNHPSYKPRYALLWKQAKDSHDKWRHALSHPHTFFETIRQKAFDDWLKEDQPYDMGAPVTRAVYDAGNEEQWEEQEEEGQPVVNVELTDSAFDTIWPSLLDLPDMDEIEAKGLRGVCLHFNGMEDSCFKDAHCPFLHDPILVDIAQEEGFPWQFPRTQCRFFATSICRNGDACSYAHAGPGQAICTSCDRLESPGCKDWHSVLQTHWFEYNRLVKVRAKAVNEALQVRHNLRHGRAQACGRVHQQHVDESATSAPRQVERCVEVDPVDLIVQSVAPPPLPQTPQAADPVTAFLTGVLNHVGVSPAVADPVMPGQQPDQPRVPSTGAPSGRGSLGNIPGSMEVSNGYGQAAAHFPSTTMSNQAAPAASGFRRTPAAYQAPNTQPYPAVTSQGALYEHQPQAQQPLYSHNMRVAYAPSHQIAQTGHHGHLPPNGVHSPAAGAVAQQHRQAAPLTSQHNPNARTTSHQTLATSATVSGSHGSPVQQRPHSAGGHARHWPGVHVDVSAPTRPPGYGQQGPLHPDSGMVGNTRGSASSLAAAPRWPGDRLPAGQQQQQQHHLLRGGPRGNDDAAPLPRPRSPIGRQDSEPAWPPYLRQEFERSEWPGLVEKPDLPSIACAGFKGFCHRFNGTKGSCRSHDSCEFYHDPIMERIASRSGFDHCVFPTKPCQGFQIQGTCPKGDMCNYAHVPHGQHICVTCRWKQADDCRKWHSPRRLRFFEYCRLAVSRSLALSAMMRGVTYAKLPPSMAPPNLRQPAEDRPRELNRRPVADMSRSGRAGADARPSPVQGLSRGPLPNRLDAHHRQNAPPPEWARRHDEAQPRRDEAHRGQPPPPSRYAPRREPSPPLKRYAPRREPSPPAKRTTSWQALSGRDDASRQREGSVPSKRQRREDHSPPARARGKRA